MDLGLRDKLCIVTGASQGIGLETSRRLVEEGATVLMVARDAERLERVADDLGAHWVAVDVTDADADLRIVQTCAEQLGGIDVLVNNAGSSRQIPLDQLTDDDWHEQLELHVLASVRLMQAAAPRMAEQGWGRIVNVSSSSGKRPSQSNVAYSVAKAAQLSASRAFADAYAARGVLINAVTPGVVGTPLWLDEGGLAQQIAQANDITPEEAVEQAAKKIPLGRIGRPEEIADVIAFLCSERAANVTGAAWSADGGSVNIIV